MRVQSSGYVRVQGVTYQIAREMGGNTIYTGELTEDVKFYDHTGEFLLEHPWPAPDANPGSNVDTNAARR